MASIHHIRLDRPAVFYAHRSEGVHSREIKGAATFDMDPDTVLAFVRELACYGRLGIVMGSLQSVSQRNNGTLLTTAFPSLREFKIAIHGLNSVPPLLRVLVDEWEAAGANEVMIDFERVVSPPVSQNFDERVDRLRNEVIRLRTRRAIVDGKIEQLKEDNVQSGEELVSLLEEYMNLTVEIDALLLQASEQGIPSVATISWR